MHAHGILNALTLALTDQSDPVPQRIHSFHLSLINNQPAFGAALSSPIMNTHSRQAKAMHSVIP